MGVYCLLPDPDLGMRATIAAITTSWSHDTDSEKWNTACIPKEGVREGGGEREGGSAREGAAGINVRLAVGGGEHEGEKSGVRVSRWAKGANKCEGAKVRVKVTLKGERSICAFQVR